MPNLPSGSFEQQQLLGYVKPGLAQSLVKGRDEHTPIVLSVGAEMVLSTYSELLTGVDSPLYQEAYKNELLENLGAKPLSAFWKIFFKAEYRGKADLLPSLIKMPVTAVTVPLEFICKNIGAVFSRPLSYLREKTKNGKSPSWGWFALAGIPWLISQPFFLLGNTFAYARRTVNAVCNLVSSATALVGDGLGWIRDKILKRKPVELDYGNKYPRFSSSFASVFKNGVLLAANTAVIGITALTAGLLPPAITSIIPSAIVSGITTAASTVTSLATKFAITAWAGMSAAVAPITQGLTSGFSSLCKKTFNGCSRLWGRVFGTKKKNTKEVTVVPTDVPQQVSESKTTDRAVFKALQQTQTQFERLSILDLLNQSYEDEKEEKENNKSPEKIARKEQLQHAFYNKLMRFAENAKQALEVKAKHKIQNKIDNFNKELEELKIDKDQYNHLQTEANRNLKDIEARFAVPLKILNEELKQLESQAGLNNIEIKRQEDQKRSELLDVSKARAEAIEKEKEKYKQDLEKLGGEKSREFLALINNYEFSVSSSEISPDDLEKMLKQAFIDSGITANKDLYTKAFDYLPTRLSLDPSSMGLFSKTLSALAEVLKLPLEPSISATSSSSMPAVMPALIANSVLSSTSTVTIHVDPTPSLASKAPSRRPSLTPTEDSE